MNPGVLCDKAGLARASAVHSDRLREVGPVGHGTLLSEDLKGFCVTGTSCGHGRLCRPQRTYVDAELLLHLQSDGLQMVVSTQLCACCAPGGHGLGGPF